MNKRHPWVRFSFCATPLNDTALMVLGGWGLDGALDSVQVFGLVADDDNEDDDEDDNDGGDGAWRVGGGWGT